MENYEQLEQIGTGSFGKVLKIKRKSDGKILVAKLVEYGKMAEKEKQQLISEVNILRELRHPNIVKYYDRIIDKNNQIIYIVTELCSGGDLQQFLKIQKQENQNISEEIVWKFLLQLILAVHEIHRRKEGQILHRDIKPANIFLDAKNNIKLGDFGLAKKLNSDVDFAYTNVGTPYYMSPEQLKEVKYNEKSDIWSIGCLLYELTTLIPPFTASNQLALALKIQNGKFDRIPNKYSDELMRVIIWCLHRNQESRPSVDDLLNIPEISLQLRKKRLRENIDLITQRELACKALEANIIQQEKYLAQKEQDLIQKEQLLQYQHFTSIQPISSKKSKEEHLYSGSSTTASLKNSSQLNKTLMNFKQIFYENKTIQSQLLYNLSQEKNEYKPNNTAQNIKQTIDNYLTINNETDQILQSNTYTEISEVRQSLQRAKQFHLNLENQQKTENEGNFVYFNRKSHGKQKFISHHSKNILGEQE